MSTVHTNRRQRDAGFTLPEVLITMLVLGIITTALAGVTVAVLRTTPPTEVRAEDARSMLGLVTWLPQDVDSTPAGGFDTDPATDACNSGTGTNILQLTWDETINGTQTTYVSNYRHMPAGDNHTLVRVTCSGTSTPYTNASQVNLTSALDPLPTGWVPGEAPMDVEITHDTTVTPNEVVLVTFEITTPSGEVVRTDSAPKNPDETLPTTTLPSWYIPTPTTASTPNGDPVAPDYAIDAYPSPTLSSVTLAVSDPDGDSLVVTLDATTVPLGWLVNLSSTTLTVSPIATDVGNSFTLLYEVDDQNGGVDTGAVTVNVVPTTASTSTSTTSTTTTSSTSSTTTTIPCAVLASSVTPSSVKNVQVSNNGQTDNGVLFKSVLVEATTNGQCDGMRIQYESGGSNSPPFVNMSRTSATTWAITLPGKDEGSSENWADGFHDIEFHSSTGGPWSVVILEVT